MTSILAIDTTLGACSAALIKDKTLLSCKREVRARGHVERLLPMIDEVCAASNVNVSDLDQIAVTIGPGTFAGVRIGLSAAKGMGLALDIPIVAVTTLEALAYQYACEHCDFSGEIAVAIDARRGEIYLQSFEINKGSCTAISEPDAVPVSSISDMLGDQISLIIGSACDLLKDLNIQCEQGYDYPDAAYVAKMAVGLSQRAKISDDISPLYLRAPDAVKPPPLNMIIRDE